MTSVPVVVVLAGGQGRRMGGDKPRAPWGRTTLIGRALDMAERWGGEVAVAVRDGVQVEGAVRARLLLDDPTIAGPLAGLASALGFALDNGADRVLTLPCDAPALPEDFAARLTKALSTGVMVAVARSGHRLHPTCALWRVEALEALPAYLTTGQRSLNGFAASLDMMAVNWSIERGDPFANANTPEELASLQPLPSRQRRSCPRTRAPL